MNDDSLRNDQVRRNFSHHAAEYDRYALVQKAVAGKLVSKLPTTAGDGRILEVGCGTGMLSREFLAQHPASRLLLSDLAHGMIQRVAEEFSGHCITAADAAALPFAAASFNLVLSSSVYQWVDDLPEAFSELNRVLMPGGRVALALFGERTLFELRQSHAEALRCGVSHGQKFPDCQQIKSALEGHFDIELLERAEEIEWHPGVPQLLRALKAIGAQNVSRQRPTGLASRHVMLRMYDLYTRNFGYAGQVPATYEVIYLLARKS